MTLTPDDRRFLAELILLSWAKDKPVAQQEVEDALKRCEEREEAARAAMYADIKAKI